MKTELYNYVYYRFYIYNYHEGILIDEVCVCVCEDEQCTGHQVVSMVEYMVQKDNVNTLAKIHQQFGPMETSK